MSAEPTRIGERIKKRREEAHLSISALADQAGVSKGYLWSLEKGSTKARPSGRTLYRIAGVLRTTMSDLLGEELLIEAAPDEEVPQALTELARLEGLTEQDVRMLAAINFRGQRPQDLEAWRLLWAVIKASVR